MNGKNQIFIDSNQVDMYEDKPNRKTFDDFYLSERQTLKRILPYCSSVLDIGSLNGDTLDAIAQRYPVKCTGIDIDMSAVARARVKHPKYNFELADFLDPEAQIPAADLVIAFNLFDHFEDWTVALRALCRPSNRFVNFSTLFRIDGPSLVDANTSFIYYARNTKRILWAVHNIYELCAYCATENICATSIYVYCYQKYNASRFKNSHLAQHSVHGMPMENILVGNIVLEIDREKAMERTAVRPDLTIIIDDKVVFDSPWKQK